MPWSCQTASNLTDENERHQGGTRRRVTAQELNLVMVGA
jgi:hypothetical protein